MVNMKKVIILLTIIILGIIGLDIYEYTNMQKASLEYIETRNTYKDVLEAKSNNDKTIDELTNELETLKEDNVTNNKEYQQWMNLTETVKNLLK